jgi:hypothetical protein
VAWQNVRSSDVVDIRLPTCLHVPLKPAESQLTVGASVARVNVLRIII